MKTRYQLDRTSATPLHMQLYRAIREAIDSGHLPANSKLPSTRKLAQELDLSRNTVLQAYERLQSEARILTRPGSSTHVAATARKRLPIRPDFLRLARFPSRKLPLRDPDGTPLYLYSSK